MFVFKLFPNCQSFPNQIARAILCVDIMMRLKMDSIYKSNLIAILEAVWNVSTAAQFAAKEAFDHFPFFLFLF